MAEPTPESIERQLESGARWRAATEVRIAAFHKTLYGNGEPGWDEMLRTLFDDYQKRKAAEDEANREARKTDKEAKLKGMQISADMKLAIIGGTFLLINSVVTWMLTR